ncbi:MAG: cystathionine gamma-synthase [Acidobacteriota bacterium]|nr:MAG: cystathionine gamma-synthase [Acidobacteriota bacterium]
MRFATKAIHAGQGPDLRTGAVNVPIYLSTTFKQDGVGQFREGYEYSRTGNPSRASLEATLAALEGGEYGLCFASGSAATSAVIDLLRPGDEVISTIDVYGGTYRMFRQVYAKYGIQFHFADSADPAKLLERASSRTRMLWIETPTNPMLNVHDITLLSRRRPEGALLVVDNTFATPFLQRPLELGADIVVHSVTKYLGGHSDVVGGALVTSNPEVHERCQFYQNAVGGVPSPFDCYLVQRGMKTLEVRMKRHQENAAAVARYLVEHPRVGRVFYPGLPDHPGHEIAGRQMTGYSGMVSFTLAGGRSAVDRFFGRLEIFTLAESLGGVESLTCHPFTMTHGAIPAEEKLKIGITEDLVRLSLGIEAVEDLLEDLDRALT